MAADDFAAIVIEDRRDDDLLRRAVDAFQRAIEIAIAPAIGMAAIADFIEIGIERAGGDFVEQRLPDMGGVAIDEDDVEIIARQMPAELGDKLQPAGAATDDDDLGLFAILAALRASLPIPCCTAAIAGRVTIAQALAATIDMRGSCVLFSNYSQKRHR